MVELTTFKHTVENKAVHHTHPWRTLFSGSSEVGLFRLKTGTNYLEREIEFQPLTSIPLKDSSLGRYIESKLKDYSFELDVDGGVSVKLGPHNSLGTVASLVSFAYRRLLVKEGKLGEACP